MRRIIEAMGEATAKVDSWFARGGFLEVLKERRLNRLYVQAVAETFAAMQEHRDFNRQYRDEFLVAPK